MVVIEADLDKLKTLARREGFIDLKQFLCYLTNTSEFDRRNIKPPYNVFSFDVFAKIIVLCHLNEREICSLIKEIKDETKKLPRKIVTKRKN